MNFQTVYLKNLGKLIFVFLISAATVFAQTVPAPTPTLNVDQTRKPYPIATGNNLYCAGFVQTAPVDTSSQIVGAENEQDAHIFGENDNVYITLGANKGVQVGDMFSVIRPRGQVKTYWSRKKDLGFYVQEVGALEVIRVKAEVAIARVKTSCDNLLLADLVQPMQPRTSPIGEQRAALDRFGDPSGKASGRIFMARDGQEMVGTEQVVYIDLGAEDNVQVGDYLTVYRPLGEGNISKRVIRETVDAREGGFQSERYRGGKFSNQTARKSGEQARGRVITTERVKRDRPQGLRKNVAELVILNVKEKTATAMIVRSVQEVHTGDQVELQ